LFIAVFHSLTLYTLKKNGKLWIGFKN
jgi:hypothetical protein